MHLIGTIAMRLTVTLLLASAVLGGWRAGPRGEAAPLVVEKIAFAQGWVSFRDDESFDIFTMNPDRSKKRRLTRHGGRDPVWSPDGREIAYVRFAPEPGCGTSLYVMKSDGSGQHRVLKGRSGCNIGSPSWSPDGQQIAFVRDGSKSLYGNPEIWVMNDDGTEQRRLTANTLADYAPDWSGDGQRIVFVRGPSDPSRAGKREIWIMNADGTGQQRLTRNALEDDSPDWSSDGSMIVFAREHGGFDWRIWVMNADGSGQHLLPGKQRSEDPTWSPDARRIVFVRSDDIWVMNADGTSQRQLTRHRSYDDGAVEADDPEWSPAA